VKICPGYQNDAVVYVPDASRSVSVASQLLGDSKATFVENIAQEYVSVRDRVARRKKRSAQLTYDEAVESAFPWTWDDYQPPKPSFLGVKTLRDYPIENLISTIDWTPFFITWDLHGKYPAILEDEVVGEHARQLFADAQTMLQQIVDEDWLQAHGVVGFWQAQRVGSDDIRLFDEGDIPIADLHFMRQQLQKREGESNLSLADFVAPEQGPSDWLGGFCVTTGHGVEERAKAFEAVHDDYNAIMLKALADRLAESFAEQLHREVRTKYWGYAPKEILENADLIREKYRGIRPAPGYPACPDHTEKATLFNLLDAEKNCGVSLTESYAMYPTAAVSGLYFSHPESRYFSVGKIGHDQVAALAARKGASIDDLNYWLAPNIDAA